MHPQIVKSHAGTCDICGMLLVRAEELGYVTSGFEDVKPLVIPATAPLYTGERSLVYVEVPDANEPTYEAREVVLGPRVGGYYIIKSGIAEGEMVVVKGAFKIDGELQIRAEPSMMSPKSGGAASGHVGHGQVSGSGDQKTAAAAPEVPPISGKPVSREFVDTLQRLVAQYLVVTDALTKDDLAKAKKGLIKLKSITASINAPQETMSGAWGGVRKELLKKLSDAHQIGELTDARSLYNDVSKQIVTLEKHYLNDDGVTHFLAFCPMAFNNSGAYWVQDGKGIRNPYFGAKMLQCGEIKEKL
jgi:Cu(I)/Ag(I) efflux system membrane fusion protein